MKKLTMILVTLSIVIFISLVGSTTDNNKPNVLILNSYNQNYNWTKNTVNSILDNIDKNVDLHVEYLDTKNFMSPEYYDLVYDVYFYKYKDIKFDAIITTDDNALKFVMEHRSDLFYDAPIFFCGINSDTHYDFEYNDQIFGVFEQPSAYETVKTAQLLNPYLKDVFIVIDNSTTGQLAKATIHDQLIHTGLNLNYLDDLSMKDIQSLISNLDENTIVLLAFNIVDSNGEVYESEEMTELVTSASNVPVYGLWAYSFGHGVVGGQMVSGAAQGERVTEMVNNYIKGVTPLTSVYFEDNIANVHMYDYQIIQKHGLDLSRLPNDSVVLNAPVTFFQKHRDVITISLIVIVILTVYIIVLRYQVKKQTDKYIITHRQLIEADKMATVGELMYRISHELNTPLGTSITTASYIENISDKIKVEFESNALSKTQFTNFYDQIQHSSKILLTSLTSASELLEVFKSFAEIQEQQVLSHFNIHHYVDSLIHTYQPILKKHGHKITLHAQDELMIKGQSKNYYQIFDELIKNSLDHGFKGLRYRKITITIELVKGYLYITYNDNGLGIPPEHIEKVFNPLFRTKNDMKHLGLGLSSIYNTIHNASGEITCTSELNSFTEFKIKIPQ